MSGEHVGTGRGFSPTIKLPSACKNLINPNSLHNPLAELDNPRESKTVCFLLGPETRSYKVFTNSKEVFLKWSLVATLHVTALSNIPRSLNNVSPGGGVFVCQSVKLAQMHKAAKCTAAILQSHSHLTGS